MSRMFTVTPKQAVEEIINCMFARHPPLLTSSPGMGKSSLVRQIAEDHSLKLIDLRLSQCTPEDLQGFPMRNGNKATFVPFDVFPVEGDEIPDGFNGWLLFLDEMTSATKPVQAAAYKLIHDRMTGSLKLHNNVAIVAAGNKMTDRAVVNQMSTAIQSRFIHFELAVSKDDFLEYAHKKNLDHRMIGFIDYMPSKLMDFRPDHQDTTFPCPRTWEFLSDLIKDREVTGIRAAGAVGEGTAVEFLTFVKEYSRLPKFRDILADPVTTPLPEEASTKYAAISMLLDNATEKMLSPVLGYIGRFDPEFQIIFAKGMASRSPNLQLTHSGYKDFVLKMVRYLE